MNLVDPVFRGLYHGRSVHDCDIASVLGRAADVGVASVILTSGTVHEYRENERIIEEFRATSRVSLYTTVGVHPTRCSEVEAIGVEAYFSSLQALLDSPSEPLVALGECGLDYARLEHSPRDLQLKWFESHFTRLTTDLPMFLHLREALPDFLSILARHRSVFEARGGVVHSFTGSVAEAQALLDFSPKLFIGLNGCSLRDEQGISVARFLPVDRILLDSDAPWCEMRPSHASAAFLSPDEREKIQKGRTKERHDPQFPVKSRNEPAAVSLVLFALARIKNVSVADLAHTIYQSTLSVFPRCGS